MKANFHTLASADNSAWRGSLSSADGLPIRDSGAWIETKHRLLTYYAHLFATGMKHNWQSRVYLELFSAVNAEIWCGDCADAIRQIQIPQRSLTFAFIDPTGIKDAPFSLIEALNRKTRCDLLINIQHGMGIKMNIHQYTADVDEGSALTKFLGNDSWKRIPNHNPRDFFRGVLELYKKQLHALGFEFVGREVLITNDNNTPLYLLLYASRHPKGKEFWDKAMKGVLPMEFDFAC